VYLVLFHDYVEGRGEISSMGGGWKFIEEEVFEETKHQRLTGRLGQMVEETEGATIVVQEDDVTGMA
jgi:hypothetical protein